MQRVIKRDGTVADFDSRKIIKAIRAANKDASEITDQDIDRIAGIVINKCERLSSERITVEQIQDLVEDTLLKSRFNKTAKAYILYREARTQARGNITDKTFMEFLSGQSEYWNSENSNKDATIVTTQRDYLAGIAGTDIARRFLLPREVCDAHDAGIIHQHDMDYMAERARHNCCLVNLEDMLMNGTVLNGVKIDPQHRLLTATTVATQIITAVSSSQYGGVTITLTHLAPFVRMSEDTYIKEVTDELEDIVLPAADKSKLIADIVAKRLKKEVRDAVQTFNYQINSMSSTNGQAPFISVSMYISENPQYKRENAMLIEEFLHQRILGLKNEKGIYITPAFPKLLYVLDEDNIHEDSEYWYITKLAAKCTAKRMVPDYISAKKMREYKVRQGESVGDVYPCMGCRSFLTVDRTTENYSKALNYDPAKPKYYGRFNLGVTTINLVDAALSSEGDRDLFWKLIEERCELCHKGLRARINRLEEVTSDVAPILWQHGALARLEKGEKITNLIYNGYSTASLGYAGLYECVKYMTGHSHTDGAEGEAFGLEVMQKLNDMCAKWRAEENIDYSVYGTPIESGTYKFAKKLKSRFGADIFEKLDGKDRNYITNSYHVPVFEEIDAFSKLALEAKFQKLSPGGAISYIETADLTNNTEAVLTVMKFIYDNIMYAELNTKSDYCQCCGYDGEILIDTDMTWYCPNCGNRDQSKMNVARRTCGYIGSKYWNYGRTQEIKERYIHLDCHECGC